MPKWIRVNRDLPCPVCGKSDWCLVASDKCAAICPRTESPVRRGNAGYLHLLGDPNARLPARLPKKDRSVPNLGDVAEVLHRSMTTPSWNSLSADLGLPIESLKAFQVGFDAWRHCWSFPMTNPLLGVVCGIRLRSFSGRKFSLEGGRDGLFLPTSLPDSAEVIVACEGATDAIAAHSVGFDCSVGRPSCASGAAYVVDVARRLKAKTVFVVRDNDAPGSAALANSTRGAQRLAEALGFHCDLVVVVSPPESHKDMRQWIRSGATRETIEQHWGIHGRTSEGGDRSRTA